MVFSFPKICVLYKAVWTAKKSLNTVLHHIPYSLHKKSFTQM